MFGHDNRHTLSGGVGPIANNILWVFHAPSGIMDGASVGVDGDLLVPTMDGTLYALRQVDGTVHWSYTFPTEIQTQPTVLSDGACACAAGAAATLQQLLLLLRRRRQ
jgi:outer membrane protein assembly factor BamB